VLQKGESVLAVRRNYELTEKITVDDPASLARPDSPSSGVAAHQNTMMTANGQYRDDLDDRKVANRDIEN
jgi:hypothetical protein